MATTKLATVFAGVALATGLSVGVGWVAAGSGSTDAATPPDSTATTVTVAQPQKKPADPKEDRARLLARQTDDITRRVRSLQMRIAEEAPEPDGGVDISVLKAELFEMEKMILAKENTVRDTAKTLEQIRKQQEESDKLQLDEDSIQRRIQGIAAVKAANNRLAQAVSVRDSLKRTTPAGGPVFASAEKEVAAASAELKAASDAARPTAEKHYREEIEKNLAEGVVNWRNQVKNSEIELREHQDRRKLLVKRIAESRDRESHRQSLQDELNVLRGIQMELIRVRTLTELGLDTTPAARPEADPRVEAQFKELKREIEALRSEVNTLRKK